jgi:hypothetical protein
MEKHPIYKLIESDESGVLKEGARSYSGRCMYGRNCLGIDGDMASIVANLVSTAMELALEKKLSFDEREEISSVLGAMRTDSMGRGTIVYFPQVEFVGEDDEDSEEDSSDEE